MPVMRLAWESAEDAADSLPRSNGARSLALTALHSGSQPHMTITPAPRWRTWINEMPQRWANRCLPIVIANEAGWVLMNPIGFEAQWSGGPAVGDLTLDFDPMRGQ